MGQQGTKSPAEARVIFQRLGTVDLSHKVDLCASQGQVVCIQRAVSRKSTQQPALERSAGCTPRSHSRPNTTEGLVYVMDNPTGGVWVKPKEKWTRT